MTHQENYNLSSSSIEEMAQSGLEAIPELVRVILNNVMQAERSNYLQAKAYERTEERKGHANGYIPKTVRTKLGDITFAIPQVREGGFYPSALEKHEKRIGSAGCVGRNVRSRRVDQKGQSQYRRTMWR